MTVAPLDLTYESLWTLLGKSRKPRWTYDVDWRNRRHYHPHIIFLAVWEAIQSNYQGGLLAELQGGTHNDDVWAPEGGGSRRL